jgi:mannose-6-phosphate isomerase-like protein (cupin superfamily)
MRAGTIALIALIAVSGLGGAVAHGQQPTPAVPDAPTDKTAFWTNDDIEARWKHNEAKKVSNSRLFNGPTNISANVRIVLPDDPPQIHDITADLWIVTAGTATAITDGEIVDANGTKSVRNGVRRAVHAGDMLYVPPGVPHHFADVKGFRAFLIRFDTIRKESAPQRGTVAAAPQTAAQAASAAVADAPADKTAFWTSDDIQARWKNNEAKKVSNSRLFNGPTNISANVRIVLPDDPPQTHDITADLWIVTAGTATAVTDGEIVEKAIRKPVRRTVHAGDLLYVPPGVPHHFTDVKGFRAFLIRFDTK